RRRRLFDAARLREIEVAIAIVRRRRISRKELVEQQHFRRERAERRKAPQLELALRSSLVVDEQRHRGGDVRTRLEEVVQLRERAWLELAVGIQEQRIAAARLCERAIRSRGE